LQAKYGFTIVDLNYDQFSHLNLYDKKGNFWSAQVSKTLINSDYVISICPPKTHNEVVYSGAIKNVVVGSLLRARSKIKSFIANRIGIVRNNKSMIHQGYKYTNQNLFTLANYIKINLAVIDGYAAMQGDGPGFKGELVPSHWSVASSSALNADILASSLMGIKLSDIGYLTLLNDNQKTGEPFVIGDNWKDSIQKFKMHSNFEKQRHWK